MNISNTGVWNCDTTEPHSFDAPLALAILRLLHEKAIHSVLDFGCGSGAYVDFIHKGGIRAVGYEGNPKTPLFSAHCHVADLTAPLDVGMADAVLSLEVGEHVPMEFEGVFLDNVTLHANKLVVLSWFPFKGEGIGHVNEQSNDYVRQQMLKRGFAPLRDEENKLRESSTLWWFSHSVLCFSKT